MGDLKSCPFCGNAHAPRIKVRDDGAAWVVCDCCDAEGPWASNPTIAAAKWNAAPRIEVPHA